MLPGATRHDSRVDAWFMAGHDPLRLLTKPWFDVIRGCGANIAGDADGAVAELLHDGRPTACVNGAAFAYVDAFTTHAAIGFFHGAELPDPAALLEGSGKRMRHAKLRLTRPFDEAGLRTLIAAAYRDIHHRLAQA